MNENREISFNNEPIRRIITTRSTSIKIPAINACGDTGVAPKRASKVATIPIRGNKNAVNPVVLPHEKRR
jgi:hypothetical protein